MNTALSAKPAPAKRRGAAELPRRGGFSARFVVCVAVLVAGAGATQYALNSLDLNVQKKSVPLKRPLSLADPAALKPRYQLAAQQPTPPSEDILVTLGTKEFLDWRLIDTEAPAGSNTRAAEVVVTYYTGGHELVPHVPEECMSAGGYEMIGEPNDVPIRVTGVEAPSDQVRLRVARFHAPGGRVKLDGRGGAEVAILYFFHSNGEFCTTRREVRVQLASLREKYSYYMKIELKFTDESHGALASAEESLRAAEPLLERLLPLLFSEHLQWDAREQLGAAAPESQG